MDKLNLLEATEGQVYMTSGGLYVTIIAIEKDPALVKELQVLFHQEIANQTLLLLEDDVRSFKPEDQQVLSGGYSLVANIPYYITGAIMRQFLTAKRQPKTMVLLMQKEVAERIIAKDGRMSLLSLSAQVYGTPEYVRTVKAGSFSPPPKVDSAILAIRNISRNNFTTPHMEENFFTILHAGFSSKRKQVIGNMKKVVPTTLCEHCLVPPTARAEELTLATWLCLAQHLGN